MLRFVLALAAAVAVVILLARWLGSAPSDAGSVQWTPPATAVETCEASGGKAIVRALPDGTVEGVTCE